jgi:myo-inositol catabolism protein IolC
MLFKNKKLWNIVPKAYVKPTSNFAECEKRNKKARTIIVMGLDAPPHSLKA